MKYGKLIFAAWSLISMIAAPAAFAGELDVTPSAPQGIIVRVDGNGTREVFKAALEAKIVDSQAAATATSQFVTEANRIQKVKSASELDRTSSNEAWCYWYSPSYYGSYYYSYSYANYSYSYYPTYSWNWGAYSYYYYYYHY
jgi:hypothetical protein